MSSQFLNELGESVAKNERRAREVFGGLSAEQLNWKPDQNAWSIGQCFDHLIKSNEAYFPIFEAIAEGTKPSTVWERLPFVPAIWGAMLRRVVHPDTVRKARAPRIFEPAQSDSSADAVDVFCAQQQQLAAALRSLESVDLDKTIITSPVARFITYSLRDGLVVIVTHEERHLNQAERVLSMLNP